MTPNVQNQQPGFGYTKIHPDEGDWTARTAPALFCSRMRADFAILAIPSEGDVRPFNPGSNRLTPG